MIEINSKLNELSKSGNA